MSKRQWLIIFGILVIITPYSGFPPNWKDIIFVVLGLLIVTVAYRTARISKSKTTAESASLPYSEHQINNNLTHN